MGEEPTAHSLDIPDFLKRDSNNRAPFMDTENVEAPEKTKTKTGKSKANGHLKADEPKKAAKKAKPEKVKAKAAAKPEKAKAAKPKAEAKVEKDLFGLRKGSSKSRAAMLYARKSGATLEEVKTVVGSVQLNVLNELEENGHTVRKEKQERKGQRPVTRYWLTAKK